MGVPLAPTDGGIATLPPLIPLEELGYPLSGRTGEPVRPRLLLVAIGLAWLSVAAVVAAYAGWWWVSSGVTGFEGAARLTQWTKPDPLSALAIIMVILIGLIALLMVAAAGTVAYNAWAGAAWVRVGGLIAIGVQALSGLLNWWYSLAMVPLIAAVVLLWLPQVKPFFAAMAAKDAVKPIEVPTSGILYGPRPLGSH